MSDYAEYSRKTFPLVGHDGERYALLFPRPNEIAALAKMAVAYGNGNAISFDRATGGVRLRELAIEDTKGAEKLLQAFRTPERAREAATRNSGLPAKGAELGTAVADAGFQMQARKQFKTDNGVLAGATAGAAAMAMFATNAGKYAMENLDAVSQMTGADPMSALAMAGAATLGAAAFLAPVGQEAQRRLRLAFSRSAAIHENRPLTAEFPKGYASYKENSADDLALRGRAGGEADLQGLVARTEREYVRLGAAIANTVKAHADLDPATVKDKTLDELIKIYHKSPALEGSSVDRWMRDSTRQLNGLARGLDVIGDEAHRMKVSVDMKPESYLKNEGPKSVSNAHAAYNAKGFPTYAVDRESGFTPESANIASGGIQRQVVAASKTIPVERTSQQHMGAAVLAQQGAMGR